MFNRRLTCAFALASTLGLTVDASAQRAFLEIPNIPGESVVQGYEDWIDVLSVRQSTAVGAKRSIACDVSVVKGIDIAGPALWATAASGAIVSEMQIVVLRGVADAQITLYEIRLTNVRITGVQATAGSTESSETVTLLPQGVMLSYFPQLPSGQVGQPITQSFSCQ